jgi:hypothetical protein
MQFNPLKKERLKTLLAYPLHWKSLSAQVVHLPLVEVVLVI